MTINLPFPELGQLEIFEVYEFYDQPVLYASRNERDNVFLSMLVEETDDTHIWLHAPMSEYRFQQVRSGGLELHEAVRTCEGGSVFEVVVNRQSGNPAGWRWVDVSALDNAFLPEPGEKLCLDTQTLKETEVLDVGRKARQSRREVVALKFDFEGITRTEAPAGLLGQILDTVQQVVSAVGQSVEGKGTTRGAIHKDVVDMMELSVAGVFSGSFGIELHSKKPVDLVGFSPVGLAIEQFVTLLEKTPSDSELVDLLSQLKGRSARKYKEFLLRFSSGIRQVDVRWGSAKTGLERRAWLTAETAAHAATTIGTMEPEPPVEFTVAARLVGFNERTKSYELWDKQEGVKYSGRVTDEALDNMPVITIGGVYRAHIREETEIPSAGEPETKYRLVDLSVLGGFPDDAEFEG